MKSALSAFLDDELDARQQTEILVAVGRDQELCKTWEGYHLIGDALRRSPALDRRLTPRVMARIENEPFLLTPKLRRAQPLRAALTLVATLAATVAGVAVVAWLALSPTPLTPLALTAQVQAPGTTAVAARAPAAASATGSRLQEYMVAHQTYSPSNRIFGGSAYVRTVSAGASPRADARSR